MMWFLIFFLLLAGDVWALPPEYEILIEKNPFSPERQYVPSVPAPQGGNPQKGGDLKQEIILRGTFFSGNLRLAIVEVRPSFKRRHQLKKDRLIVAEGEKVGPCSVEEVRRGEIVLGGGCPRVVLRLADSPDRKRPLAKKSPGLPINTPSKIKNTDFGPQKPSQNKKKEKSPSPPPNPFKKIFEKQKNP